MRVFVFVNRVEEIGFRQTTALLIASFHRLGHEVYLANVDGLSIDGSKVDSVYPDLTDKPSRSGQQDQLTFFADAFKLKVAGTVASADDVAEFAKSAGTSSSQTVEVHHKDLIFIRTNPGRDLERASLHTTFLESCQVAKAKGIRVVNDPDRLSFFASKAAIAVLPDRFRPEMLVTNSLDSVANFIRESKCDCVVKPLLGSRGENVIRTNPSSANLEEILEHFREMSIVVQHFVNADEPGDKRVVVLGGKLIEHEGHLAGIHRFPAAGDFRANLHAGGTARPLNLTQDQRKAALTAASILNDAGILLAGVDLIGNKVIEFNVFSTGGLYDANHFSGFDISEVVAQFVLPAT